MRLIDVRTSDGSRHFYSLPKGTTWDALRNHMLSLPGLEIVHYVPDGLGEGRIDFTYGGHRFAVRNGGEDVWFVVRDPRCSDVSLYQVAWHCARLLGGTANF